MKFRDRINRFFYGRYGNDQLNTTLLIAYLTLLVFSLFFDHLTFTVLGAVCLIVCLFRMLSKDIHVRRAENDKFLRLSKRFTGFFKLQRNRFRDRKTHVYRRCPSCRAMLRLPKKKGEHSVCCPACKKSFGVKI